MNFCKENDSKKISKISMKKILPKKKRKPRFVKITEKPQDGKIE